MPLRLQQPAAVLLLALVAAAAWALWLGWDQQRDVHPDGSVSGPYQVWQVAGLVLTLLPAVVWAAAQRLPVAAVLGTSAGLTAAAWWDWSDDGSGLYVIGVGLVAVGALVLTGLVTAVTGAVRS